MADMIIKESEKNLLIKLSSLVEEYGIASVLSMLETLVSDNADMLNGKSWEIVRQNLEDSVIEIEEYGITGNLN